MKRGLFLLAILAILPASVVSQEAAVWRGLAFDIASPEDAAAAAGKAGKRRSEKIKVLDVPGGRVPGKQEVEIIEFEKIDGWEKVSLSFTRGKLFKAKFWPPNKTMKASDLPTTYTGDFVFVEGFAKGVPLSVFEGQKEAAVPKVYPAVYYMVSAQPDRYILTSINNGSFGTLWKQLGREATVQLFPGFVEDVEVISRIGEPK